MLDAHVPQQRFPLRRTEWETSLVGAAGHAIMTQANMQINPTDSLARLFHRRYCSADFPVCGIAGFQTRERRAVSTPCRFGNRRYSRFGNLRHASFARVRQRNQQISTLAPMNQWSSKLCWFVLVIGGLLLAEACPAQAAPQTNTAAGGKVAYARNLDAIKKMVETLRGKEFLHDVPAFKVSEQEMRGIAERDLQKEYPGRELADYQAMLVWLDMVPPGTDLPAVESWIVRGRGGGILRQRHQGDVYSFVLRDSDQRLAESGAENGEGGSRKILNRRRRFHLCP